MKLIMLKAFDKFKLQGDKGIFIFLNGSTIKNQSICVGEDGYTKYLDNDLLVEEVESEESYLIKENKRLQRLLDETIETMIMDNY